MRVCVRVCVYVYAHVCASLFVHVCVGVRCYKVNTIQRADFSHQILESNLFILVLFLSRTAPIPSDLGFCLNFDVSTLLNGVNINLVPRGFGYVAAFDGISSHITCDYLKSNQFMQRSSSMFVLRDSSAASTSVQGLLSNGDLQQCGSLELDSVDCDHVNGGIRNDDGDAFDYAFNNTNVSFVYV